MPEAVVNLTPMSMLSCVTICNMTSCSWRTRKKTGKRFSGGEINAIMSQKKKQILTITLKYVWVNISY